MLKNVFFQGKEIYYHFVENSFSITLEKFV